MVYNMAQFYSTPQLKWGTKMQKMGFEELNCDVYFLLSGQWWKTNEESKNVIRLG